MHLSNNTEKNVQNLRLLSSMHYKQMERVPHQSNHLITILNMGNKYEETDITLFFTYMFVHKPFYNAKHHRKIVTNTGLTNTEIFPSSSTMVIDVMVTITNGLLDNSSTKQLTVGHITDWSTIRHGNLQTSQLSISKWSDYAWQILLQFKH